MRKKLIEVALPLEAINREAAREKSIRHGHPSTLHLWWARRPLAACRAVLFASLVDDPDQENVPVSLLERIDRLPLPEDRGPTWSELPRGEQRRKRLFAFIEKLVKWENTSNAEIIETARDLIRATTGGNPPPVLDPFCGGGSIPLEAQRLGMEPRGSDLNPVAVLITKALIEIPPRFANQPPVNPEDRERGMGTQWHGAAGLAADVRYYGDWILKEAEKRIGHLYPKLTLGKDQGGGEATVVAWMWARTIRCPNPACGAQMPLVRSFWLAQKRGQQAWIDPVIDRAARSVAFAVRTGGGAPRPGTVNRGGATCIVCATPVPFEYVRAEGKAGRMGSQLMAVAAEGNRRRLYLPASEDQVRIARSAQPQWSPDIEMPHNPFSVRPPLYGLRTYADVFTPRQLVALETFHELIALVRDRVRQDAEAARALGTTVGRATGGSQANAYGDAVATYLAFAVDKGANYWSTLCAWHSGLGKMVSTFSRQAMPMIWDYTEANPFSGSSGNFKSGVDQATEALKNVPASPPGVAQQMDATESATNAQRVVIATDPPYYNNVDYADLSDYFYVWLRRSLAGSYPELFATLLTPKDKELVATPYRFDGDKTKARKFFEQGLWGVFAAAREAQHEDYPLTVFYAFKQSETEEETGTASPNNAVSASTGWETMLTGLLRSGLTVVGTWPMRTELVSALKGHMSVLASSIVLVCRPRAEAAALATRREFQQALKAELPEALRKLQHGNIPPVDLAQAAIGPGMAVFSRYSRVLDANGQPLSVRTALQLINQVLDEVLAEQDSEYDPPTRWAVAWFEQFGMNEGGFGDAETLSKAKAVAVAGLEEAGILRARSGRVRLLRRDELPGDWDPTKDRRITVWEVTEHLIRAQQSHGDSGAATLLAKVGGLGDVARDLAYRLYVICDRKGWAQEALAYNGLVAAWPEIARLATSAPSTPAQGRLI